MTDETIIIVQEILEEIMSEALRLYQENGKTDYEAGRCDGVKWCSARFSELYKQR